MTDLIRQLGDPVVFQRFLQFADYPEIVRLCGTHPALRMLCKKSWAQKIIANRRAHLFEFLWALDKTALDTYCKSRPDVCRVKEVHEIVTAVDAAAFFEQPLIKKKALTLGDWREMRDDMFVEFTQSTVWFQQTLQNVELPPIMGALDFIEQMDMAFEMTVYEHATGTVQMKWNGEYVDPELLYVQGPAGRIPITQAGELPDETLVGVVPMVPLYELRHFPLVRTDRLLN